MLTAGFARRLQLLATTSLAAGVGLYAAATPARADMIDPGTLLISTTTYQDSGVVSNLVPGASLPGPSTATAGGALSTVNGGKITSVFDNNKVDGSFGVTSAITINDVNVSNGSVLHSVNIDPNIVSTSFSSKSELGLNVTNTSSGYVATFMGYAGGGVGNLDVSNSDTTAYKDTTNPVTSFFAPNNNQTYGFNRSVVALKADGTYSTTQTLAYGGNNGRAALLAPNGLYYTVGNSNNGSGTPSQLTTTTGLEVVTPGSTPNSTMIDPSFALSFGGKADKAGKDSNFRSVTLGPDGQLYFTKGSGSNGINTIYTVSNPGGALPTAANAASAVISIPTGFATDQAKIKLGDNTTGGNYTPFGLFFANATTLYAADEGTGNSIDGATHAGLEKWSLVGGVWTLDYTLRSNLIGQTYQVAGWQDPTTIGLRNLAGRVNADGTVSLWATTSTSSGSGDNGADPNEVVQITDNLLATSLPLNEQFSVLEGPQLGLRYGGVAFAGAVPEPSTWAMMLLGFAVLGFAAWHRPAQRATA